MKKQSAFPQGTPSKETIKRRFLQLEDAYGSAKALHENSPTLAGETVLDCLIATLLTQATNDNLAMKAFIALKKQYPHWESVAELSSEKLARIIGCAGLGQEKAKHILGLLKTLQQTFGELSLERLRTSSFEETRAFLMNLQGVGPKTAACVQAFALSQPSFPVDTHVHRILKRWNWIGQKTSPQQGQKIMEGCIPNEIQADFHVYLIHHGRTLCKATKPRCEDCKLSQECERYGV